MKAFLILEDGTVFTGQHIGADREVISEIVFNTSMTGYLEVLTDPSYAGQAVCMTYPLIGNYGICEDDMQSDRAWPDGFIVHEISEYYSNFRSHTSLRSFLLKYDIPGIQGIDTRALTKILREKGTMNGCITTNEEYDLEAVTERIRAYSVTGVVKRVSVKERYSLKGIESLEENGPAAGKVRAMTGITEKPLVPERVPLKIRELNGKGLKIAILDVGMKKNIAASLVSRGCDVTVFPCDTKAEDIIAFAPDGIMISNGPGDPKECTDIIREIKKLYDTDIPIFAICLGHQLMALATGADTHKMKYGHRGSNHPVKDLETEKVYITSQNHGYMVDESTVDEKVAAPLFRNVNDGTNEGLIYRDKRIFTVQFHPEACAGPLDSGFLFDRFISMVKEADRG